jgi:hypothetical protein
MAPGLAARLFVLLDQLLQALADLLVLGARQAQLGAALQQALGDLA